MTTTVAPADTLSELPTHIPYMGQKGAGRGSQSRTLVARLKGGLAASLHNWRSIVIINHNSEWQVAYRPQKGNETWCLKDMTRHAVPGIFLS